MSISREPSDFTPVPGALSLRVLSSLAEMDAISANWSELETSCSDVMTYYQGYDWCRNWIAVVSKEAGDAQPHVVTVWLGPKLIALLPLMVTHATGGVRVLGNLGEPHSQYSGILTDPVLYNDAASTLLSDYLRKAAGCDLVNLDLVPQSSLLNAIASKACALTGIPNENSVLDLTHFASSKDYLASLAGSKAKNRDKRRRKLEKNFGTLAFREVWAGEPEFGQLVKSCIDMKKIWLAETGRISTGFALTSYGDFLASLSGDRTTREGLVALVLSAGERVIAIEISMIRKGHMYTYIGGFDWELRTMSPGKVQMEATVCWAIDNSIKAYDLLGNAADYKDSWSNIVYPLHAYTRCYTSRGWLYANLWLLKLRPAIKAGFHALPASVRQSLQARFTSP